MKPLLAHTALCGLLCSALQGIAYAEDGYEYTNDTTSTADFATGPKLYAGGSLGAARQGDTCNDPFFNGKCDNRETTWKAFGGVRLNPMFGGEVTYHSLGGSQLNGTTGAGNPASLDNQATGISVTGVGYVPVMPNTEAFGKAGALFWERETTQNSVGVSQQSTDNGTSPLIGGGVQYRLNDNVHIRGEWEHSFNVGADSAYETDVDVYSVGMSYSTL